MNGKMKYGKSTILYTVLKSKRRKTSEIQVDEKGVELRVPFSKTDLEIKNIMEGKKQWIYKKQLQFRSKNKFQKREIYKSFLPYLGKNCLLRIALDQDKNSFKFKKSIFQINLLGKRPLKRQIQKLYENWLNAQACKYLEAKTVKLGTKTGLKPSKILVKPLKGRWGSATKEGVITLNSNLMKFPKDTIDYIIIHELCHLKIQDHSHRYWNLVRKHYPKYQDQVKELEILSRNIL